MGLGTYGDTRLNPLVGTTPGLLKNYKNRKWVFYDPRVTETFDFTFPVGSAPDGSVRGRLSDEGLIAAEEPRVIQQGDSYPPAGQNPGNPSVRVKYNSADQYAFVDSESLVVSDPTLAFPYTSGTYVTVFETERAGACFFVISKNGAYLQTNGLVLGTNPVDVYKAGEVLLDSEAPIGFPADAFDNLTLEGLFMLGDSNSGRDQRPPNGNDTPLDDLGSRSLALRVGLVPEGNPDTWEHGTINIQFQDGYQEGWNYSTFSGYEDASQSIYATASFFGEIGIVHDDQNSVMAGSVSYPLRSVFDPNEYTHIAVVKSGREARVYVNGSLVETATWPVVTTNNLLNYFAVISVQTYNRCKTVNYVQYNGKPRIKNVRFCNKALYSGSTISPEEEPLTSTILERLNIK